MTHKECGIHGGRRPVEGRHVVLQRAIAVVGRLAQQPEFLRQGAAGAQRGQTEAAIAGHHRGDSLAGLAAMFAIVDQRPVVMGMHIDEAGGEDAARAVDGDLGLE